MNRDVILLGIARESSTRMEDKMLRPFDNTTLFKIYLDKLVKISRMKTSPFSRVVLALNKNDRRLWNIATKQHSPLEIVERSDFSVGDATQPSDLFHYLKNYSEDYVIRVNACFPFLTPETIITATNYFKNKPGIKTLTCVKERSNWFWNPETGKPITLSDKSFTTTQQSKPIFESVHCFHILNRKNLLNNILWNFEPNDPHLYVVSDSIEFLDIDTNTEFQICESVWKVYENLWCKK